MNRQEHMDWCKTRALAELDANPYEGPANALASILSDLRKHPETKNHAGAELTMMLAMSGHLDTADKVREHIKGFN